jgi:hypothetical protein
MLIHLTSLFISSLGWPYAQYKLRYNCRPGKAMQNSTLQADYLQSFNPSVQVFIKELLSTSVIAHTKGNRSWLMHCLNKSCKVGQEMKSIHAGFCAATDSGLQ